MWLVDNLKHTHMCLVDNLKHRDIWLVDNLKYTDTRLLDNLKHADTWLVVELKRTDIWFIDNLRHTDILLVDEFKPTHIWLVDHLKHTDMWLVDNLKHTDIDWCTTSNIQTCEWWTTSNLNTWLVDNLKHTDTWLIDKFNHTVYIHTHTLLTRFVEFLYVLWAWLTLTGRQVRYLDPLSLARTQEKQEEESCQEGTRLWTLGTGHLHSPDNKHYLLSLTTDPKSYQKLDRKTLWIFLIISGFMVWFTPRPFLAVKGLLASVQALNPTVQGLLDTVQYRAVYSTVQYSTVQCLLDTILGPLAGCQQEQT